MITTLMIAESLCNFITTGRSIFSGPKANKISMESESALSCDIFKKAVVFSVRASIVTLLMLIG